MVIIIANWVQNLSRAVCVLTQANVHEEGMISSVFPPAMGK